ncbi:MAG: hypothetical protein IK088_07730 [Lachnospiraceae bacterium]|nr:hypothetical protein [Lachnospiraceae bacterium]
MDFWKGHDSVIKVAAHRGWSTAYPENTMEAFRAAAEIGVDQIETDIRITKDGELVLIHDATVDRTTDGTGRVADHTLKELQKLDAGKILKKEGEGYRIPTYEEFLCLIDTLPDMTLDLELKERPEEVGESLSYEVTDRVLAAVETHGFADRIVINTFSGKLHEYIRHKYGDRYRQHVYYPVSHLRSVKEDPYAHAYCVCMFQSFYEGVNIASPEEFEEMRRRYPSIEPWAGAAVKDEATLRKAIKCRPSLITCNDAGLILGLLRKEGLHE